MNIDGQNDKLQIKNTGHNDTGSYVCSAINVLGQAKKEVTLTVEGKHNMYLGPSKSFKWSAHAFVIKKTIMLIQRRALSPYTFLVFY